MWEHIHRCTLWCKELRGDSPDNEQGSQAMWKVLETCVAWVVNFCLTSF